MSTLITARTAKTYITGAEADEDKVTAGGDIEIVGDIIIGTESG